MTSSANLTPVGVVGLGLLGTALAERLLKAGYPTHVYNRSRDKAVPLEALGAMWSDNPLASCDRVVICLYTTGVVDEVLRTKSDGLHAGQVLIDATTGDPHETAALGQRLASQGIDYLESPIAASSEQTRQGLAVALVSGPKGAFDLCSDLFAVLTAQAHYVGAWGNAARTKLVNNLILGLNRAVLAEGLWFAESIGLDVATTLDLLRKGNAYSGVMDTKGQKMIAGDFAPQAKLSQHAKDVRLMIDQLQSQGLQLPFTGLHLRLLELAEEEGLGELDNCAIIRAIATAGSKSSSALQPGTS